MNDKTPPEFIYTADQARDFEGWQTYLNEDGILPYGKYEGQRLEDVPTDWLNLSIARLVANAILMKKEVDRRSFKTLLWLCTDYPDHRELFIEVHGRNYGQLTEDELAELKQL